MNNGEISAKYCIYQSSMIVDFNYDIKGRLFNSTGGVDVLT